MKIILSPAKKQVPTKNLTPWNQAYFYGEADKLIDILKSFGEEPVRNLLGISQNLGSKNWENIQNWTDSKELGSPALYTYIGEVFNSLNPKEFSEEDIEFAEEHIRILSGLYGVLKPMDSIKPHRLDVADSLKIDGNTSLYNFWKPQLTEYFKKDTEGDDFLLNLASLEYSSAIDLKALNLDIITPEFKEYKNGKLKVVTIWAKKMRGFYTREVVKNRITTREELKNITLPGYKLDSISNDSYLYIKE